LSLTVFHIFFYCAGFRPYPALVCVPANFLELTVQQWTSYGVTVSQLPKMSRSGGYSITAVCNACKVKVDGILQLDMHLAGKLHAAKRDTAI
jgi:hypothetical protein